MATPSARTKRTPFAPRERLCHLWERACPRSRVASHERCASSSETSNGASRRAQTLRSRDDAIAGKPAPTGVFIRILICCVLALPGLATAAETGIATESWRDVPMPEGFRVVPTPLDGPVFATADGRTVYTWPQHKLRNGYSGEGKGAIECTDEVLTVTAGLMSPYPPGIELPELEQRKSCTELWPPVLAADDAEPVGKWTILERPDGRRQWAFDEQALYLSVRDSRPGDVLGGTTRRFGGDAPAKRVPAQPPWAVPPGFAVKSTSIGRMLTTDENDAVYAYAEDTATSTACTGACLDRFEPVTAPALARPKGDWTLLERSPGVRQWVYRGDPLYTHVHDRESWSQLGSDEPGWSNVFTQHAPAPPESFTVQATIAGNVLADPDGRTIYVYHCGEDSEDQLACDHPETTQVYRLAMCGGGDWERCLEYWPYVEAGPDETSPNRAWRIARIDPRTGRFADEDDADALRVWTYRDRPVYLHGRDERPGDVNGGGTGEWRGQRNGLKAFWLRDDYMGKIL
jgi:predicted lipoprotein with Yx(FWY)xxD motif